MAGEKASRKRRRGASDTSDPDDGLDIGRKMREHAQGAAGEWFRCKAAEALLSPLRKHHPHLEAAYIVVLSGPLGVSEGCKQWGRARRLKKTERALLAAMDVKRSPDYVIEVDTDTWEIFDVNQRLALLDHELCHMAGREIDEDGVYGQWKLRGHDCETFLREVQRHGAWRPVLKDLARVMRQLDLGL
jgi:predicted metallopeptidase